MDRWLAIIPKGLLLVLVVGGGILFIVLSDPPHTVCESQLEIFRQNQKRFLFLDPKKEKIVTTRYQRLVEHCKVTNDPGGCFELFSEMRTLIRDIQAVPSDCLSRAGDIAEVKKAVWEVEELLPKLAWGEKPPTTYHDKFGWLDTADVSLFCSLKRQISSIYGDEQWGPFQQKMLAQLPGIDNMAPSEVLDMTLFSERCENYP